MKSIFRIEKYWDSGKISVRFCPLHSTKPIDEYKVHTISTKHLDLEDCDSFIGSLMKKHGYSIIESQSEGNEILNENKSELIHGRLDINDIVGKIVKVNSNKYNKSHTRLYMRRIAL